MVIPDPEPWLPLSVGMALTAACLAGIVVALAAGRSRRSPHRKSAAASTQPFAHPSSASSSPA